MLYIIDGTGDKNDSKYHAEMENGFCRLFDRMSPNYFYIRDPHYWGLKLMLLLKSCFNP